MMSSFDYSSKCGKLSNIYKPEHECCDDKDSILEWGNMLFSECRSLEAHCFDLEQKIESINAVLRASDHMKHNADTMMEVLKEITEITEEWKDGK